MSTSDILAKAGYDSPMFAARIEQYLAEMRQWNKTHNLTAITDPDDMVKKHIIDSLSIAPYIDRPKLLDIGTGAGLPGIPLAMHCPETHFTLLDALSKRTFFLQHIKGLCDLTNVRVVHARIEAFAQQTAEQGNYQLITCRAFASLVDIVRQSYPLLASGGRIIAMKGEYPTDELEELQRYIDQQDACTLTMIDVVDLRVHDVSAQRHLVILEAM